MVDQCLEVVADGAELLRPHVQRLPGRRPPASGEDDRLDQVLDGDLFEFTEALTSEDQRRALEE